MCIHTYKLVGEIARGHWGLYRASCKCVCVCIHTYSFIYISVYMCAYTHTQLLGEIARGHWGLCRASVADVTAEVTARRNEVSIREHSLREHILREFLENTT